MKIALIDPVGAKMGMNHYDDGLMNALGGNGFNAYVISNYVGNFPAVQYKTFFQNRNISRLAALGQNLSGVLRAVLFCRNQKIKWVLFHIFRGGMFDLFSLMLAKIFGLKILLIVHDIETIDTTAYKFIKRIVLRNFHDALVVHNRYSAEKINEFTDRHPVKNMHVIPHGNYLQLAEQTHTREEALLHYNLDPSQRYLLFFGQIKKTKGLDVLLEALYYSKTNYKLIIAGKLRIESFDAYQNIINKYNLQDRVIIMLRFIPDNGVNKLFSLCDAVVLPYKIIYQSGVLLMAMSFGKTVIASDLPSFKEIIQHEKNGLLFEKNNPSELAKLIDNMISGKYHLDEMSKNAKGYAEKYFSWIEIAKSYSTILN
jgi:D-inositol-3-phosphate glycosyltransferase